MARRTRRVIEQGEHALRSATPEVTDGLVHRCETESLGHGVAVEADDGELSGNIYLSLAGDLEHSEGHLVGQTEHRSRTTLRRQGEHLPRCCCAALDGVRATEFDGRFETSLRHNATKSLEPES